MQAPSQNAIMYIKSNQLINSSMISSIVLSNLEVTFLDSEVIIIMHLSCTKFMISYLNSF